MPLRPYSTMPERCPALRSGRQAHLFRDPAPTAMPRFVWHPLLLQYQRNLPAVILFLRVYLPAFQNQSGSVTALSIRFLQRFQLIIRLLLGFIRIPAFGKIRYPSFSTLDVGCNKTGTPAKHVQHIVTVPVRRIHSASRHQHDISHQKMAVAHSLYQSGRLLSGPWDLRSIGKKQFRNIGKDSIIRTGVTPCQDT